MKQYIRKADILLLIVLVAIGLAASAAISLLRVAAGADAKVIIESGGKLYAVYSLFEDRTVTVPAPDANEVSRTDEAEGGDADADAGSQYNSYKQYDSYNKIEIKDGKVSVTEASCKNQVCVKKKEISEGGESIVCLPNRLIVRIDAKGTEEGDSYDSVTS